MDVVIVCVRFPNNNRHSTCCNLPLWLSLYLMEGYLYDESPATNYTIWKFILCSNYDVKKFYNFIFSVSSSVNMFFFFFSCLLFFIFTVSPTPLWLVFVEIVTKIFFFFSSCPYKRIQLFFFWNEKLLCWEYLI